MLSRVGDTPEFFDKLSEIDEIETVLDELERLYEAAKKRVEQAFGEYAEKGTRPADGHATYPYLLLNITAKKDDAPAQTGFGSIRGLGYYGTTLTQPSVFRSYLRNQLTRIASSHEVQFFVGPSDMEIPVAFVINPGDYNLDQSRVAAIKENFVLPDLTHIHDDLPDGITLPDPDAPSPLSLFSALRTDYSLARLKHYTGTSPRHFQRFVIFTNYQRYVDEFIEHAHDVMEQSGHTGFVGPGLPPVGKGERYDPPADMKLPQMPAYHLMDEDGNGITLINIGVGPSNAKTITDHVAVLRPHCWLMVGHCGGLRHTQTLGDFVLAHAYLRDDQVLDGVLPVSVPLPTIAEVQIALTTATSEIMQLSGQQMKRQLRTGTVVTTADRNWEMRYADMRVQLNQSRAIAIDMESATIAANGYRYRVPYGTLLCVSDRPLHGEIKLPGSAEEFYRARVSQHLDIGLRAMLIMKDAAQIGSLHSRKLRSFDEPLFR